jgi:chromosomal replication initiator protein
VPVDTSARHTWEAVLGRLQLQVTRPSFDTWLRGTVGVDIDDQTLVVAVPTPFAAEWLERRMHALIVDAVNAVTETPIEVSFQVGTAGTNDPNPKGFATPVAEPAPVHTSTVNAPVTDSVLNPHYTFDRFVVGGSNQLAYAASMAVADAPGQSYNPLFLYGAVGLGKTHLLQAIGARAQAAGRRVAYVTCEQFTNEFLAAIKDRRTELFRARYRSADLLLIDDVQFISGKEGTQEGFFHTFNALHDSGRQIVLTCDRPPSALPLLEERLRSRFEWGLLADIGQPSLETRTAMLSTFAESAPVDVPREVIDFIAERTKSNVRLLQGCLNRVTAMAHFTDTPVTIELAHSALGVVAAEEVGEDSPKAAIAAIAAHFGLPQAALVSGRRDRAVASARQVAMYILSTRHRLSPEAIGAALGGRDRTTVLYSVKKVSKRLINEKPFADELALLLSSFPAP